MDSLFEYFLNNQDHLLFALAAVCLLVELALIGLNGPLLFFSIGFALTGVLVSLNIVSAWEMQLLSIGSVSVLSALLLWHPLKRFQGQTKVSDNSSDMIGQVVPVSETVTLTGGTIRHSGINWNARLDEKSELKQLEAGDRGEIKGVDGNTIIIDQLP